ncbi:MAG: PrsW family intramembrane metalloprotease, partial [Firmicutes bacterium]|nr:PrsW family intramembrane metalloprotease [Bacillota bacterium]
MLILVAAAVIPAIWLLRYVYRMDRIEAEPRQLIISLAAKGIIATFCAMATEYIGTFVLGLFFTEGSLIYNALMYFIVVALSEEGFKYFFLKRFTWNNPEFNCTFDGVVYAVSVSLGFALWENIGYVFMYGLDTALLRAVTAIPGHACFGVFMGVFYGAAKRYEVYMQEAHAGFYRKLAVIFPVIIHGAYDFIASLPDGYSFVF